ncbi:hypothetical protein [Acinetobacter guillouiae]|uniref:hypothetical protein n=1 Tax=Acinetobacter guillouiae TaxID=106649 RepID=UPI0002CEEDC4|nr:hypothetical protein F981_01643 [Acinetobacter guillouiae CIP 63.46]
MVIVEILTKSIVVKDLNGETTEAKGWIKLIGYEPGDDPDDAHGILIAIEVNGRKIERSGSLDHTFYDDVTGKTYTL